MAKLEIDGATFGVVEQGSGDPLVFIHGSASDHRTWQASLGELGNDYRAIAYSRRYHWPNDRIAPGADYSMAEQVDDLAALLRRLDAGPVHLVGHSYGAFIALLLTMRTPPLVRTLVLVEPPVITLFVSNEPRPSELLKLLLRRPSTAAAIMRFGATGIGPATAAARRGDMEAAMRVFGTAVLGAEFYEKLSSSRLEQVRANTIREEFLGSGFPPLRDDDLRRMQVPALLVSGEHSPSLFPRLLDRLEELLPNTERVEISGASHIVHEDNAAAFHAAVRAFLGAHEVV